MSPIAADPGQMAVFFYQVDSYERRAVEARPPCTDIIGEFV